MSDLEPVCSPVLQLSAADWAYQVGDLLVEGSGDRSVLSRPVTAVLAASAASPLTRFGAEAVVHALTAETLTGRHRANTGLVVALDPECCPDAADRALELGVTMVAVCRSGARRAPGLEDRILGAGGAVLTAERPAQVLASLASVVVVVDAPAGSDVIGGALEAARLGRSLLVLEPSRRARHLAGAKGLLELLRIEGARARTLGAPAGEPLLIARKPLADGIVERLEDLDELLATALLFAGPVGARTP